MNNRSLAKGIAFVVLTVMSVGAVRADNRGLVAKATADLQRLNREVLASIKNPGQYNNKDILVRVRVIPQPDGRKKLQVEKITIGKEEKVPAEVTGDVLYLKGTIAKDTIGSDYKVDLSHILPEDGDKSIKSSNEVKK